MDPQASDDAPQADAPEEVVQDLVDLLLRCPAFSGVDRRRLGSLVRQSALRYAAADSVVDDLEGPVVVQRGSLLLHDADGRPVDVVAAEEYLRPASEEGVRALEGTLMLLLPDAAVDIAWSRHPGLSQVGAEGGVATQIDLQTAPVRDLMATDLVTADAAETCRAVAARMTERRVSSVVVLGGDEPGIVTDRDLRSRLVAVGGSLDGPVGAIATSPIRTVTPSTPAFSALMEMLARGIHHLPVAEDDRLVGMVTSSDLLQLQTASPLHLRKALDRATSTAECAAALESLPDAVRALRAAGTTPGQVGEVLSTVADRLVARLLALAQRAEVLGPAPAPFGWIAFGSLARREISLGSDQDTGLILPDGLEPPVRGWFARLGAEVTDGLAACGMPRCRGGVMASEPAWRTDVSGWRQRITGWLVTPTPQHLMGVEIAFDLRTVAGDLGARQALGPVIAAAPDHGIFLARLAQQAVAHRPPLGFRGRLTVDRSGDDAGTFDLKRGALMPIVDLARVHTLSRGGLEVATADRLRAAADARILSADLADTLRAGHELALGVRLDQAVERLAAGLPPSNRLDPGTLPPLLRSQLKEAFKAIRTAQEALQLRYQLVGG